MTGVLIKGKFGHRGRHAQSEEDVKTLEKDNRGQAKERDLEREPSLTALQRNEFCLHLEFGHLASRIVR